MRTKTAGKGKRMLGIFLSAAMIFSASPVQALGEEGAVLQSESGEVVLKTSFSEPESAEAASESQQAEGSSTQAASETQQAEGSSTEAATKDQQAEGSSTGAETEAQQMEGSSIGAETEAQQTEGSSTGAATEVRQTELVSTEASPESTQTEAASAGTVAEGTQTELEISEETVENDTEQTVITAWEWIYEWELIDPETGIAALPGASEEMPAFFEDITELLPAKILAVTEGCEEQKTVPLVGWSCEGYPEEGAYKDS